MASESGDSSLMTTTVFSGPWACNWLGQAVEHANDSTAAKTVAVMDDLVNVIRLSNRRLGDRLATVAVRIMLARVWQIVYLDRPLLKVAGRRSQLSALIKRSWIEKKPTLQSLIFSF